MAPDREKTVLIVEDNEIARFTLETLLEQGGYRVLGVKTEQEAFAIVEAGRSLDLILTDLLLDGGDGRELLRRIRLLRDSGMRVPPLAFVTGSPDFTERDAFALGAAGLFIKPLDYNDFLARVGLLAR